MEIVCSNYEKEEKKIISLIKESDYISFDLEMTGIENDKNNILFDTPKNRYIKYKKTANPKHIAVGSLFLCYNENHKCDF